MSPRIKAFSIHLALSLVVLFVLLFLIYKVWYPQPFFSGDGGWQGIRLVAGVDIILGPLLTLVAYNIKKPLKELRRDLTLIGLLQLSALAVGTWLVYDQRTRLIVYADGFFQSLSRYNLEKANPEPDLLKNILAQPYPIAVVNLPDDPEQKSALLLDHVMGESLHIKGARYELLTTSNLKQLILDAYPLHIFLEGAPKYKQIAIDFIKAHGGAESDYVIVPINLRYKEISLVLDKQSGKIIGSIPISQLNLSLFIRQQNRKTSEAIEPR